MKDNELLIEQVLEENKRRHACLEQDEYDPMKGVGCWGDRVEAGGCLVPTAVIASCPDYATLEPMERDKARIVEDFEYWCVRCVTIRDKMSGRNVPFVLNRPQRRLLAVMEGQRAAGAPVRVILLKARQWGGSTLVQMYLAWMQLVRHKGWNSLICGHMHATSKSIKRMYNLLLRHYPRELLDDEDDMPRFTKLEGQPNVQQITARDCLVLTGSARSEDAVRGYDIAMAHLSEVAFWQASAMHSPDEVVRSVCGSIALKPETVIVLESTANGVGDYFHDEWLRALAGRSDKEPLFVPWTEISIYSLPVDDASALLLKARQWGGSTLVQMYLAWMQLVRHKGWNSLICGHMHATSKSIKRMYNLLLRHYPRELLDDEDDLPRFTKLEGQPNVQQITSRDCLVLTGSARSEDAVRGYDIAMAHLSEVAFWQASAMHSPDEVVRSVCGSIALKSETVIVLESTANGVGDYFHDEWLRALAGRSDKEPLFVPWTEISIYSLPVDDASALWQQMDDYERQLWNDGCTLEQVNWYHHKRREYRGHEMMMAEYPTTSSEAFAMTGGNPFDRKDLDALEAGCVVEPIFIGDIQADGLEGVEAKRNIRLVNVSNGLLKVWEMPERDTPIQTRYMVVVDVGGRSNGSDYSVIAVWRMGSPGRQPTIVAQWRGHIDHDMLGWKAMQLACYYNRALLVIESNTLTNEAARAGESEYILRDLSRVYGRLYERAPRKLGFHTNVKTKRMAIAELIRVMRCREYVERDIDAVNEMRDYEEHNGRYAARPGKHDDILMTRAIGLLVMHDTRVNRGSPSPDKSIAHDNWQVERIFR